MPNTSALAAAVGCPFEVSHEVARLFGRGDRVILEIADEAEGWVDILGTVTDYEISADQIRYFIAVAGHSGVLVRAEARHVYAALAA